MHVGEGLQKRINLKKGEKYQEIQLQKRAPKRDETIWKNFKKVMKKGGKNEEKTLKKSMWEKAWVLDAPRGILRPTPEPNKHNKSQQDTYKPSTQTQQWAKKVSAKKVSEEGWV